MNEYQKQRNKRKKTIILNPISIDKLNKIRADNPKFNLSVLVDEAIDAEFERVNKQ